MTLLVSTTDIQLKLVELTRNIHAQMIDAFIPKALELAQSAFLGYGANEATADLQFQNNMFRFVGGSNLFSPTMGSVFNSIFNFEFDTSIRPQILVDYFAELLKILKRCMLHPVIVQQTFQSIFKSINKCLIDIITCNSMLCCRSRAQRIQLNISVLQEWATKPRNLHIMGIDVRKLMQEFLPVLQLLQFLQVVTTIQSGDGLRDLLASFHGLSIPTIYKCIKNYRFEIDESLFSSEIEDLIQSMQNESVVGENKDHADGCFRLPMNPDDSFEWNCVPSIPVQVLDMLNAIAV